LYCLILRFALRLSFLQHRAARQRFTSTTRYRTTLRWHCALACRHCGTVNSMPSCAAGGDAAPGNIAAHKHRRSAARTAAWRRHSQRTFMPWNLHLGPATIFEKRRLFASLTGSLLWKNDLVLSLERMGGGKDGCSGEERRYMARRSSVPSYWTVNSSWEFSTPVHRQFSVWTACTEPGSVEEFWFWLQRRLRDGIKHPPVFAAIWLALFRGDGKL